MSETMSIRSPARSLADPFRTPSYHQSSQNSIHTPFSADSGPLRSRFRKFKSARLRPGEYDEKPWTQVKDPRKKWEKIIFWVGVGLGVAVGGFICYLSYASVSNFEYCPLLIDEFHNIDTKTWNYEIQRGGFGSGSFEWTTDDPQNVYTDAAGLHIVPTITTDSTDITLDQLNDGYVLNLTTKGTCTATEKLIESCSIRSNKTAGTIINPVRSARLNTKGKVSLKYGKVEVVAKMPKGDWLWPAIWMMPEDSVYGPWPASGEIDIAESRGNDGRTYPDGRDSSGAALHWGPIPQVDAFYMTAGKHNLKRQDYSDGFHTFGLEWSEKYIFMYIDSRLLQVMFLKFNQDLWTKGNFAQDIVNHTALVDPWAVSDQKQTPFDQNFYLILNVAVGSTNGFFPDGVGNKPWADESPTAQKTFWDNEASWKPTWGEGDTRGMTVQSVKMWNQGACGTKAAK